jgi:hypothetical protein
MDTLVLKMLPVQDPEQLMVINKARTFAHIDRAHHHVVVGTQDLRAIA